MDHEFWGEIICVLIFEATKEKDYSINLSCL